VEEGEMSAHWNGGWNYPWRPHGSVVRFDLGWFYYGSLDDECGGLDIWLDIVVLGFGFYVMWEEYE
jgi:hypothetical protein